MKRIVTAATVAAIVSANAAVPLKWTVETSRFQPAVFDVVRGETLDLEATFKSYGKDVSTSNLSAYAFWQTNGMSSAWWATNAVASGSSARVRFTPEMDPGSATVTGFIGLGEARTNGSAGCVASDMSYRAAFTLRFRHGPGATPDALPSAPIRVATAAELSASVASAAAAATNYTDAAAVAATNYTAAAAAAATNYTDAATNGLATAASVSAATNGLATTAYADSGDAATLASAKGYTDTATADLFSKTGGVITGHTQFTNSCYFEGFTAVDHLRFYDVGTSSVLADIFYSPSEDGLVFRTYDLIGDGFLHFWYIRPQGIWVKDFIWLDDCTIETSVTNRLVTDFGISNVYTKAETDASISAAVSGIATAANVTNIAEYVVSTNGFLTAAATNALASVAHTGAYGDLSGTPTIPAADYALTNITGAAFSLASGQIGNVTLGASQTNLNITLDFAASPDRSGDCLLLAVCAADTRLAVGPAETVDILGTLDTLKAGTNVVSVTRLKVVGTTSLVMVNVKEIK